MSEALAESGKKSAVKLPPARDAKGRLLPGRAPLHAEGRPAGSARKDLREALRNALKPEDIEEIVVALAVKAKEGDVPAAKELFDRLFGKSAMVLDPETAQGIVMNLIARGKN